MRYRGVLVHLKSVSESNSSPSIACQEEEASYMKRTGKERLRSVEKRSSLGVFLLVCYTFWSYVMIRLS